MHLKSIVFIFDYFYYKLKLILTTLTLCNMLYDDLADEYSQSLIALLEGLNLKSKEKVDLDQIKKAMLFAKKYHGTQKRNSGEPYYSHPTAVAEMVAKGYFKTDVVIAALLHDIIEDTIATALMITAEFGSRVTQMVEGVTRIKLDEKITSAEMFSLLYEHKDKEAIVIKIYDRIHNMQTIGFKSIKKQKKIAVETLRIFMPIAAYFEMLTVEQELLKMCYAVLKPKNSFRIDQVLQNVLYHDRIVGL